MKIILASCAGRTDAVSADAPLVAALQARDVQVEIRHWNDTSVLWHRYDAIVIRTTWDWYVDVAAFTGWLDRVQVRTQLLNPPQTLAWGLDKRFLLDLAASNVAVVPTLALSVPDAARVARWAAHHGYDELILKPSLSAGSIGVVRTQVSDIETTLLQDWPQQGVRLVQPYLRTIETDGELSIVFIDGKLSHGICKTPKVGEFRIQSEYGGKNTLIDPDAAAQAVVNAAIAAIPGYPVFVRIDMLHDGSSYRVIEVEVIEPDLYFSVAPQAADRLAQALVKRVSATI
jgi:glutathione synthase/RimK-type ligase-like ATP-grasp enzyme